MDTPAGVRYHLELCNHSRVATSVVPRVFFVQLQLPRPQIRDASL